MCWHCCPAPERHRYPSRGKCDRCVADDDERPAIYTPKSVRAILRQMKTWEELCQTRIAAEDVQMAMAALDEAGRLTNLEKNVLRERLYFGWSEETVARRVARNPSTVRRAASAASRKIAVWLGSPTHGMESGYRRLLTRIFDA